MRFLFPLLKSHTPKFVYYEKDSNSRHLTALDDETFSEKKENKTSRDQKKKKLPSNLLATETNKERERDTRERKRKI